jgi:hypothetical protein
VLVLASSSLILILLGVWSIAPLTAWRRPRVLPPGVLASFPVAPSVDVEHAPVDAGNVDGGEPAHIMGQSGRELPSLEDVQATEGPAADVSEAEQTAATPSPRPRPRREYPLPTGRFASSGPLSAQVVRWQQVVEAELAALTRVRRLDPNITPHLVLAVIAAESNGDPLAVSPADAVGLMQILPSTFADLQGDGDPFDPNLNVRAGITYLDMALRGHQGDLEWALAGYNAGIAGSLRARAGASQLFDETIDYVTYVMYLLSRPVTIRAAPPSPSAVPLPSPTRTPPVMREESAPNAGDAEFDATDRMALAEQPPAGAQELASDLPSSPPHAQPARADRLSVAPERSGLGDRTASAVRTSPPPATSAIPTIVVPSSASPTTQPTSIPPVATATATATATSPSVTVTATATPAGHPTSASSATPTPPVAPSTVPTSSPSAAQSILTTPAATGSPAVPAAATSGRAPEAAGGERPASPR